MGTAKGDDPSVGNIVLHLQVSPLQRWLHLNAGSVKMYSVSNGRGEGEDLGELVFSIK